jgi:type II secretory pathway pseudopilin PulG
MIRSTPSPRRPAMTLFELLLVLAFLVILVALMLPAIVRARGNAQRTRTTDNLKQLALAVHNYHAAFNFLPTGVDDNHFSVVSRLLPFLEQDALYKAIDFKKPIDDKANTKARRTQIKMLLSPNDPIDKVKDDCGATNYLFNDQVFFLNSKLRFGAITDGWSNTIMVGDMLKGDGGTKAVTVQRQYVVLGKDALKGIKPDAGVADFKDNKHIAGDRCACWIDGRFLQGTFNGALRPNDTRPDVSCAGAGGVSALRSLDDTVYVVMCDATARPVNAKKISHKTWQAAMTHNNGDLLGDDW